MATQTTTRSPGDQFSGGIGGSLLLHGAVVAIFAAGAYLFPHLFRRGQNWGNSNPGAVQATMIDALPFPPKPPTDQQSVLATETPSPAPIAPAPKAVEVPKPEAIPILAKPSKPVKTAAKTSPAPPPHPQPIKIEPHKVQTGEAAASIPMSSAQTRAGTVSVNAQDAAFGARFAYYVQEITQKVASQWYTNMLDPQAAGHRVYITFQVERDGSLSHIQIAQRSGDNTLDQTALSAVQHIDTFPPLPDAYSGSHINVTYYFDPPSAH